MRNLLDKALTILSARAILREYFDPKTGAEYGISHAAKLALLRKARQNRERIPTASHPLEHLVMATKIMSVPRSIEGCVVECGCWKGGSTANLSLVCALCNRELHVFDSFAGLPTPAAGDAVHRERADAALREYRPGEYAGGLEEVRANIAKYGRLDACSFHPGVFSESMRDFTLPCIFAFVDVDLRDSLRDCLAALWPQMQVGCALFSHEARDEAIAGLFFDASFWSVLGCKPPQLIGAGSGLGLVPAANGFISDIGYTVKRP